MSFYAPHSSSHHLPSRSLPALSRSPTPPPLSPLPSSLPANMSPLQIFSPPLPSYSPSPMTPLPPRPSLSPLTLGRPAAITHWDNFFVSFIRVQPAVPPFFVYFIEDEKPEFCCVTVGSVDSASTNVTSNFVLVGSDRIFQPLMFTVCRAECGKLYL